jgi:hypothetical protein
MSEKFGDDEAPTKNSRIVVVTCQTCGEAWEVPYDVRTESENIGTQVRSIRVEHRTVSKGARLQIEHILSFVLGRKDVEGPKTEIKT